MACGAEMPCIGSNQNGARMTNIFSSTGFLNTASSQASRTAPAGQKTTARDQMMNQIAAADPSKAKKAEEKLSSMQQALEQMQQMRQDMSAARKEAAKQKVARIKAQIQAIKMMGGDAEGNARKLARLARELASAAREYKAAGGTDAGGTVSTAAGASATPQADKTATPQDAAAAEAAPVTADAAENAVTQTPATTAAAGDQPDTASDADDEDEDDPSQPGLKTGSNEDSDFAKELRKLRRQIEAMLEKEKYRIALEEGKPGNRDTRAAEAALRDVERYTMAIENPLPSINIQI